MKADDRALFGWRTLTPSRRWQLGLIGVGALLVLLLASQVFARVSYPWDLYFWSESPFLTNMLKLRAGEPVFGDPADANSFVYTPGLEYLTYAMLAPFGAELNIVACRAVSVAMAVLACVAGTAAGSRLLRDRRNYKTVQQIAAPAARRRGRRTQMLDPFFGYQALPHLMNAPVDIMVPIERSAQ